MRNQKAFTVGIICFALFLSGVSALIFEILWLRLSGLVFGNSVWAAALILSSFMTGLALGTGIAASSQLQRIRPLQFYAVLEVLVALLGCSIVFGLPLLGGWLRPIFQELWNHQMILNGLRFLLSFIILVLPATAMGLTLPLVLEDPLFRQADFGRMVGLLYGCNTLGAVAGALLAEALLIREFGIFGASVVAGVLNGIAAAAAALLARRTFVREQEGEAPRRRLVFRFDYRPPWRLLATSFGVGCILLALEVVWFRFLRLYVSSSSIAFSIMLAVVLAGIGLGGALSGAIPRRRFRASAWLPGLLLLAAIATLISYQFFPVPVLKSNQLDFYYESGQEIGIFSLILMFPVAFVSGFLFPVLAAGIQERVPNRMNSAGLTILCNTTGAALGPLLAAFVFLPAAGFQKTLIGCGLAYAGLALLTITKAEWSLRSARGITLLGLFAGLAFILARFPYDRDEVHFANTRQLFENLNQHLLKRIEGTANTWQLLRRDLFGQPYYYRLLTDGFSMSATSPRNQRYMRLFAYLPLTLQPKAESALVIAFGCGNTADALTHDRGLKRIDVVDISKEVLSLADEYRSADRSNPLRDPRVRTILQDGRFFLQASPQNYDVITGEPPPPKVAGTVNLYTEQFFKLMKNRLNDGGIATFWLPIYLLTVDDVKAVLRGFHNAFPNASVWSSSDQEWIMMGIKNSVSPLSQDEAERFWRNPETRSDLAQIGIETPEQLAALFLMDGEEIDRMTEGTKPLTDFFPKRLSDTPPDRKGVHALAAPYYEATGAAARFRSSPLAPIWPDSIRARVDPMLRVRELRYRADFERTNWMGELDTFLRGSNLRTPVLEILDSNELKLSMAEHVAGQSGAPPAEVMANLIAGSLAARDYAKAVQMLESEKDKNRATPNQRLLLIYLYCLSGDVRKAEALAASTAGSTSKDPSVEWLWEKLQAEFGFHPPD